MREHEIQKACIDYLELIKIPFIRNNTFAGKIIRRDGSTGYIKNNSFEGAPDILVFVDNGITLHIEIKSETGRQSKAQKYYQSIIERLGHFYFIIRSVNELQSTIKKFSKRY